MKHKTPSHSEPTGVRQRLTDLRQALLKLHKTLLDSERVAYEKIVGQIRSPNHFLQLVTNDPWFAWLHPLSQLIVAMDEALDAEDRLTAAKVDALVQQSKLILVASETGEGFSGHYYEAMQRDPDVVMMHAEVVKLRNPWKS